MLAEDVSPSRLERSRRAARRLVHDLRGDRVGLIAFAGASFILAPLTVDAGALLMLVDALDPTLTSAGGTEMGAVLEQGRQALLAGDPVADRVLVVFSDGEGHDTLETTLHAAERLRRDGVRLVLVAQGGPDLVTIPVRDPTGRQLGIQRDPAGVPVGTRRRDDILTAVADAAHGVLVGADVVDQAAAVRDLLAGFTRSPQASSTAAQDISRAWVPLLAAAILLLAHTITRRSMALVGIALALAWPVRSFGQAPRNPADAAWRRGDFRSAAAEYLAQARAGVGGDTVWFNLGTAALAIGDTITARIALERLAQSLDPDLRFRALYNLGLLRLRLARADSAHAAQHLAAAARAYREALLLEPNHPDAKWNLELALAQAPPPSGGGPAPPPPSGGGGGSPPPAPILSRTQAEQILNSIAAEERRTLLERNRRRWDSRENRGRKDW
jgi:Ca-activated chloride channel family protein